MAGRASEARRLVVVNWSTRQAQCYVRLALPILAGSSWELRDLLSPAACEQRGDDLLDPGLYLDMPGHSYHLFDFQRR